MANLSEQITDEQLNELLMKLVEELDYDMFKEIYVIGYNDFDEQQDSQNRLLKCVREAVNEWT